MKVFPVQYTRWKLRMTWNLIRERREFVILAASIAVLGLAGTLALWQYGSQALADLLVKNSPKDSNRVLSILAFSTYVAYFFMALANVISRFFGPQRMEEREQLMGPLSPTTLFVTELIDACRLPMVILFVGIIVPTAAAGWRLGLPPWVVALFSLDLVALFIQPTLLVTALYIATIRFLPAGLMRRQWLLFVFFFGVATLGAGALNEIRQVYHSAESWSMAFPSSWAASILPFYQSGVHEALFDLSGRIYVLSGSMLAIVYLLYRFAFIEQLERFGIHLSAREEGGGEPRLDGLVWRTLARRLGPPVAAIVLKDLRSSRRDTAQRIAFTALAAVIFALVIVDLLFGRRTANIFLPIFFAYALFLVSCQGLSTFSAEGGVLENLARFPLEAGQILTAKIVSHFLLFAAVVAIAMLLAALAPAPLPVWFRAPVMALVGLGLLPMALFLAWITVTLGAIFPKPGEGGGRKEISIFAMSLFFQLAMLLVISVPLSCVVPVAFGLAYLPVPLVIALCWLAVLRFLYLMAERAVGRALGAEMRAG